MLDSNDDRMQWEGQVNLEDLNMRIIGLYHDRQPLVTQIAIGSQTAGTYVEVVGFVRRDESSAAGLTRVMLTSEKREGELSDCLIHMI